MATVLVMAAVGTTAWAVAHHSAQPAAQVQAGAGGLPVVATFKGEPWIGPDVLQDAAGVLFDSLAAHPWMAGMWVGDKDDHQLHVAITDSNMADEVERLTKASGYRYTGLVVHSAKHSYAQLQRIE